MKCPHCDSENEIGTIFCKNCGNDIILRKEKIEIGKEIGKLTFKERFLPIAIAIIAIIILLFKITKHA